MPLGGSNGGGGYQKTIRIEVQVDEDIVRGSIREFVNNADGPAFLERTLMGLGVDEYVRVHDCANIHFESF